MTGRVLIPKPSPVLKGEGFERPRAGLEEVSGTAHVVLELVEGGTFAAHRVAAALEDATSLGRMAPQP